MTKEIRIGNIVASHIMGITNPPMKVVGIEDNWVLLEDILEKTIECHPKYIIGVTISEEYLKEFGFEKKESKWIKNNKVIFHTGNGWRLEEKYGKLNIVIKYVHTLQNALQLIDNKEN